MHERVLIFGNFHLQMVSEHTCRMCGDEWLAYRKVRVWNEKQRDEMR